MNQDLDVIYTFQRWFSTNPDLPEAGRGTTRVLRVPVISRFVATHYSYEA